MHRISARRVAGTALTAVIAVGGSLTGSAAQAAPAAASHNAATAPTPAGFTDPPSGPDNVSCAALIPAAKGSAPAASTTTPTGLAPRGPAESLRPPGDH